MREWLEFETPFIQRFDKHQTSPRYMTTAIAQATNACVNDGFGRRLQQVGSLHPSGSFILGVCSNQRIRARHTWRANQFQCNAIVDEAQRAPERQSWQIPNEDFHADGCSTPYLPKKPFKRAPTDALAPILRPYKHLSKAN